MWTQLHIDSFCFQFSLHKHPECLNSENVLLCVHYIHVYVHACVYAFMFMCVHVCSWVCIMYVFMHVYVCTHVFGHVLMYVYPCICVSEYGWACVFMNIHLHVCEYVYICGDVCMCERRERSSPAFPGDAHTAHHVPGTQTHSQSAAYPWEVCYCHLVSLLLYDDLRNTFTKICGCSRCRCYFFIGIFKAKLDHGLSNLSHYTWSQMS